MSQINLPFVILLAEDEPADAHLVKTALAENHILADLRHVLDGREVMEYLRREGTRFANAPRPDLIMLDLNMPRMDGLTLIKNLRALPQYKTVPILMLTTESSDAMKAQGKAAGATGWLVKPFDPQKLIEVVKKVIG